MVSTETLRRYPFFGFMSHTQLRAVAQITQEIAAGVGELIFEMNRPADALYLLTDGEVELHYLVIDEHEPHLRKDFLVGTINPGEIVAISALIPPFKLTANGFVSGPSQLLKIEAAALRQLCAADHELAMGFERALLKATMDRLQAARVQLAAATTPL